MGVANRAKKYARAGHFTLQQLRDSGYLGFARHISFARWAVFTKLGSKPPDYANYSDLGQVAGLEYSRDALRKFSPLDRARRMVLLLSGIPGLSRNSLLIVGPRYEEEIFYARGLGWSAMGIKAVDLLSYSNLIDCGDMHSLPYSDESFDAVCCGWTLSYSRDPLRAAGEMSRVLKRGGYLAVGIEVAEREAPTQIVDILVGDERIQATHQVQNLFPSLHLAASFTPEHLGDAVWVLVKPF